MIPLILLALTGCFSEPTFDTPIPPDQTWGTATPSPAEAARFADAAAYSADHNGLALLVIRGTDILFEQYEQGFTASSPKHLYSGTKSFSCALALSLEADGLLDLDAPVAATLPSIAGGDDITATHLLQFSSGVEQRFSQLTLDSLRARPRIDDKYAYALALPDQWPSGSRFEYGSSHLMIFGALVNAITADTALHAMQARFLDPIGFRFSGWLHDPSGNTILPYGAWTSAREWAKFGVLIRDDGAWQGQQVLPAGTRDRCAAPSPANPAYGTTFWLNHPLADDAIVSNIRTLSQDGQPALLPGGPDDLFAAAGADDQRLYILPSQDLVIVRLGTGHRSFRDADLLGLLLAP